jgi:iron-regulated transporter 1
MIWSEAISLIPVVVYFAIRSLPTKSEKDMGPVWSSILLFSGMALSRVGLYGFDLAELQIIQEFTSVGASSTQANMIMGQQLALENVFDMGKVWNILSLA